MKLSANELMRRYEAGKRNFRGVTLSETILFHLSSTRPPLPRTNLEGIDLSEADLRKAKLVGAKLSGANLEGATITDEQLAGVAALGDFDFVSTALRR